MRTTWLSYPAASELVVAEMGTFIEDTHRQRKLSGNTKQVSGEPQTDADTYCPPVWFLRAEYASAPSQQATAMTLVAHAQLFLPY